MYSFISKYEQKNKFNEDIARNFRYQDDMVEYLVDVCKAQADTIPYVEFDGYDVEEDESKFPKKHSMPINGSRVSLITFHFTLTFKDEVEKIKVPVFIPKLIDNYYFILNGNKYYAIYQNVDAASYNTRDSVILKSLLMPIILKSEKKELEDIEGNIYDTKLYLLNLFKKKANFLNYYFAALGFDGALEYFNCKDDIQVYTTVESLELEENEIAFQLNKTSFLVANKEKFLNDNTFKSVVSSVVNIFSKKSQIGRRDDIDYWMVKLGQIYTTNTNNQMTKAASVLLSFKRILDDRTRKNLRIPDENKSDIFALIKWMINNFEKLSKMDNLSLINKRLRLAEYQINGFNRRISTNTYRILNSKTLTMAKLKAAFNIPSNIIISELQTSELMRYNNAVNDLDLFVCGLKYSNRGPSSLGEGSKKTVSSVYRAVHISHLGRLSLNNTSASDPGMSGTISPFVKTDGFYYDTAEISADNFDILNEEDIENTMD